MEINRDDMNIPASAGDGDIRQNSTPGERAVPGTNAPRPVPQGRPQMRPANATQPSRGTGQTSRGVNGGQPSRPMNGDPASRPMNAGQASRSVPGGRPIRAVTRPPQGNDPTDPSAVRRRQSSALHPYAQGATPETTKAPAVSSNTRTVPVQSPDGASKKEKKKDKEGMRDRLREEGNNAVMSLVKAAIYLVCVLLVSGIISVVVIMVANDVFAFVKTDEKVTVSVPAGTDVDGLSDILSDAGLIKYPAIFRIFAGHEGVKDAKFIPEGQEYDPKKETVFIAGTYELSTALDYEDLIISFLPPVKTGTSWVTIPEGYTTDEIIDLLVEKGIGKREKYVDVINNYDFDFWFIDELEENGIPSDRIYRLDGYLFPDTYEFYNESKEETVINKLLVRFAQIFTDKYRDLAEQSGYSVDEIVTLASMIEKEAGDAADYFYISEVFRNRLEDPMQYIGTPNPLLGSDATVMYYIHHTTGKRPSETKPEDNDMDVPYNTYLYPGLPPGPISNPSATAIVAAMHPSTKGYCYFITGKKDTYFATSLWEHLNNTNKVANGWE